MTSLDHEEIRRAQAERRMAMQQAGEGNGTYWFLALLVVLAVIGGFMLLGSGNGAGVTPVTPQDTAPAPAAAAD